jgi:hypothetical protein
MELRLLIDDTLMDRLQDCTDTATAADVTREALRLLDWATAEIDAGNEVVSVTDDGVVRVPMIDALMRAQHREQR